MPRVAYAREQQGYRVFSNPNKALHGLGQAADTIASSGPAPDCTWWMFFTDPVTWQECQTASGNAQIQSVVTNAKQAYGPDSPTAQVAQQAALQQEMQLPGDIQNISDYYGAGQLVYTPGGGSPSTPWWLWVGLGVVGVIVLKHL